jgi:hypothetical protein
MIERNDMEISPRTQVIIPCIHGFVAMFNDTIAAKAKEAHRIAFSTESS